MVWSERWGDHADSIGVELRIAITSPILATASCTYHTRNGRHPETMNPIVRVKAIVAEIRRLRTTYGIAASARPLIHLRAYDMPPLSAESREQICRLAQVVDGD